MKEFFKIIAGLCVAFIIAKCLGVYNSGNVFYLIMMLWLYCIIAVCFKIKDIRDYIANHRLKKKLTNNICKSVSKDTLKVIFALSPRDIAIGEKVISPDGKQLKKMSSIKDAALRMAAENRAILSFAIDTANGKPYKILKITDGHGEAIYDTNFSELNKFLEINESAFKKYKKIDEGNCMSIVK